MLRLHCYASAVTLDKCSFDVSSLFDRVYGVRQIWHCFLKSSIVQGQTKTYQVAKLARVNQNKSPLGIFYLTSSVCSVFHTIWQEFVVQKLASQFWTRTPVMENLSYSKRFCLDHRQLMILLFLYTRKHNLSRISYKVKRVHSMQTNKQTCRDTYQGKLARQFTVGVNNQKLKIVLLEEAKPYPFWLTCDWWPTQPLDPQNISFISLCKATITTHW